MDTTSAAATGPSIRVIDADFWTRLAELLARANRHVLVNVKGEPVVFDVETGREVYPGTDRKLCVSAARLVSEFREGDNAAHQRFWAAKSAAVTTR